MPTEPANSRKTLHAQPQILVFDVDGVLVDVRGTYWRSALDTVRYLSGRRVTYAELHEQVCRLANVLKACGVKKGDRVTIYMPMIPEAAIAMLGRSAKKYGAREPAGTIVGQLKPA